MFSTNEPAREQTKKSLQMFLYEQAISYNKVVRYVKNVRCRKIVHAHSGINDSQIIAKEDPRPLTRSQRLQPPASEPQHQELLVRHPRKMPTAPQSSGSTVALLLDLKTMLLLIKKHQLA